MGPGIQAAAPAGYGQRLRKRCSGRRMRPIRRPLRCSGTKALDIHIRGLSVSKESNCMQERSYFLQSQSSRQSFAARRRRNQIKIRKLRGHVPRSFLCSDFGVCERSECARKSASHRKNACIFERACRQSRQAQAPDIHIRGLCSGKLSS